MIKEDVARIGCFGTWTDQEINSGIAYHVVYESCDYVREFACSSDGRIGRILQFGVVVLKTDLSGFAFQTPTTCSTVLRVLSAAPTPTAAVMNTQIIYG